MTLTNYKNKVIKDFQNSKLNIHYSDSFTLPIQSFLKEIVSSRIKVEKNCCCSRCKYLKIFHK